MAEAALPSPTLPSMSSLASESFIVPSDSLVSALEASASVPDAAPRSQSPTAEKQGLLEALEQAHTALARSRAENDDLKEQLTTSQRQIQDQNDQINMLRGKVEEARRGVMRLQTENRRQSQLQLQAAVNTQELRSSKRASFILPPTPASPGGLSAGKHIHRRISSMSDPGFHNDLRVTASPPSFATSFPESISGRVTPPAPPGPSVEEVAKLRADLASCQQALQEATDAREASETAVRALKEFIAEYAVGAAPSAGGSEGLQGLKLPPLPSDVNVADAEPTPPPKPAAEEKRGWGSWLKRDNSATSVSKPAPATTPSIKTTNEDECVPAATPSSTTPLTNFVSSWTRSVSSASSADAVSPASTSEPSPAQPSGFRKFSLFGRTAPSLPSSSTPSSQVQTQCEPEPEHEEARHVPAPLQLKREGSVRDSVSSATISDAPEPISPPADMVDIALDRGRLGEKEDYAGERTPTVGSTTGFAM